VPQGVPADPPTGQLEPEPQPPTAAPPATAPDGGGQLPAPGGAPQPAGTEPFDVPRLFVLRTLPSGMEETSTTVRQTTRDDEVVQEQETLLDAPSGEVSVRATRSADAEDRFDELVGAGGEEVPVRGVRGHLLGDGRLVWFLPGTGDDGDTLLVVEAPDGVGTDELLTIGNGLELVR
jgi:hypothetical protein